MPREMSRFLSHAAACEPTTRPRGGRGVPRARVFRGNRLQHGARTAHRGPRPDRRTLVALDVPRSLLPRRPRHRSDADPYKSTLRLISVTSLSCAGKKPAPRRTCPFPSSLGKPSRTSTTRSRTAPAVRNETSTTTLPTLPKDKPRYVMGRVSGRDCAVRADGRGHDGLRAADAGGAAWAAFTSEGRLNIKNRKYAEDQGPATRNAGAWCAGGTAGPICGI